MKKARPQWGQSMRNVAMAATGLIWLLCGGPVVAANDDGMITGCDVGSLQRGWKIVGGRRVYEAENQRAVAHQMETPVYAAATGNARASRALHFSEYVLIAEPGETRIPIKDTSLQPLGWVNRNDVLCRPKPMNDSETGLYRRAVVRTATDLQGRPQEKEVYHSLDKRCEGPTGGTGVCAKVTRFNWYFVYAEMQGHYLIAETEALSNVTQRLLGWLPAADALNWNTAVGLRPSEQLANVPQGQPEKFVCAYATVNDLTSRTKCNEVLGGKRWFNLDTRISVLKENGAARYYDVAFSNAFRNADAQGRDPTTTVDPLKKLDVFFVIDGTKSMQPAIDGVKNMVGKLKEKTKSKLSQGGVIRYGFRVYRDSAKDGPDGVTNSERLALSSTCDKSNDEEFARAFQPVKAFESPGDDDFPENLFGGLMQASTDIAACPDHTKLVFVIGDHGYDVDKQRQRGHTAFAEAQVSKAFRKGTRFNSQPIVIFIQTPSEIATAPAVAKERYGLAYQAFQTQGANIMKGIYEGTPLSRSPQSVITLPPGSISAAVVQGAMDQVETYLRPDVLAIVTEGLRSGESLVQIIERLRGNSALNIPIRYLQFVETSVCERLGPRCRDSVLETVSTAALGYSDDVVPEVMITKDQLISWISILDKFNSSLNRLTSARERRNLIVNALLKDIGDILQINVENTNEGMSKALQFRGGLPEAANSKLMAYSPVELTDPTKVPPCELDYLVHYASRKHDILKMIFDQAGQIFPSYQEEPWPEGQCPGISAKGKNIPQIRGEIRPLRLNEPSGGTNYSFMRSRGGDAMFWIPVRYLP